MELHPILDRTTPPNAGLWYVMSAAGECPSSRVGHTCTYIPGQNGNGGKVFVIGGANPSGPFAEVYILDLVRWSWDTCESPGLKPLYEHSAFVPKSHPTKIYIFGGADQGGNHNDILVFDTVMRSWTVLTPSGTPPSRRTYHTASACAGDQFIVYSGGQAGSDPVGDRQVHCYDAAAHAWSTLNMKGDPPKPRHGHLMVAIGNKVYLHGGMAGMAFYDDLHVLDLTKRAWQSVKHKRAHPSARAAHGGVAVGTNLYVFGGMNRQGALDDLWKLDTVSMKWSQVEYDGPAPACRLDFAVGCIDLQIVAPSDVDDYSQETLQTTSKQAKEVLEQHLRLGSAGSGRSLGSSLGSAGSHRSSTAPGSAGSARLDQSGSAGSARLDQSGSAGSAERDNSELSTELVPCSTSAQSTSQAQTAEAEEGACASAVNSDPTRTVKMYLVLGGMDTEGEIFDDVMVYLVDDNKLDQSASAHDS